MPVSFLQPRASLLDRLIDQDPQKGEAAGFYRTQDIQALKDSIQRDLSWLLSTRLPYKQEQLDWENRSVIDYGIPDFADYYSMNPEDWRKIADILERTIKIYEPRLANVRVSSSPIKQEIRMLRFVLQADLRIKGQEIPLSFPLAITGRAENLVVTLT